MAQGNLNKFAYAQLQKLVNSDRRKGTPWDEGETFLAQHHTAAESKGYNGLAWLQRATELVKRHSDEHNATNAPKQKEAPSAPTKASDSESLPKAKGSTDLEGYLNINVKKRKEYEFGKGKYKQLPVSRGTKDYGSNDLRKFAGVFLDYKAILGASKFSTGGLGVAENNADYKRMIMGLRLMAIQGYRPAIDFFKAFPEYSYEKKLVPGTKDTYGMNMAFEPLYKVLKYQIGQTWNKPLQAGDGSVYAKGIYDNVPKTINALGKAIVDSYAKATKAGWGSDRDGFVAVDPSKLKYETDAVDVPAALKRDARTDATNAGADIGQALSHNGVKTYDASIGRFVLHVDDRDATQMGLGTGKVIGPDFTADDNGNVVRGNGVPIPDPTRQLVALSADSPKPNPTPTPKPAPTPTPEPNPTPTPEPNPNPTPKPKPDKQPTSRLKGPSGFLTRVAAILRPGTVGHGTAGGGGGGGGAGAGQHGSVLAPSIGVSASTPNANVRGRMLSALTGRTSAPRISRVEKQGNSGTSDASIGNGGQSIKAQRNDEPESRDAAPSAGNVSPLPDAGSGALSGGAVAPSATAVDPIGTAVSDVLASESPEDAIAKARQDLSGMGDEQIGDAYSKILAAWMSANGYTNYRDGLPAFTRWLGYDYYGFIDAIRQK